MLVLVVAAMSLVGPVEADRARIQRHLAAVEAELRATDVAHLPATLQAERRRNLDRLHAYRVGGEFPRNTDFAGERVPYFIDDDGVACAVGHLVIESGHAEVALEIHKRENNARLLAMQHPALPGWIAASGLTAAECAKIQPEYCSCEDEPFAPVCSEGGNTYANACIAVYCENAQIAHTGPCKPAATTTGWPEAGSDTDPDASASSSTDASSTGESDGSAARRHGCHFGQDGSSPLSLVLLSFVVGPRRRRS
jgi:hypothetical protein